MRPHGTQILIVLICVFLMSMSPDYCSAVAVTDPPHDAAFGGTSCVTCHDMTAFDLPNLIPDTGPPLDVDDCNNNRTCLACHEGVAATDAGSHSSLTTSNKYGTWRVGCSVCHNQHSQEQNSAFGTTYGKFIRRNIDLRLILDDAPPAGVTVAGKSGRREVKFTGATGTNSFADDDGIIDGICQVCHTKTNHFRNTGEVNVTADGYDHTPLVGTNCMECHNHSNGFTGMGGGAHETHVVNLNGPQITCYDCHATNDIPYFQSGTDGDGDGKYDLPETDVCNNCHSADGVAQAKSYWPDDPGTWLATDGEQNFCGSCHDQTPGNSYQDGSGNNAPDIIGDDTNYGYYVTGHGKTSGTYALLSWQDTAAAGNPAAARTCTGCHDLTSSHFASATKRLKPGFENDGNNSNCKQCHDPGAMATGGPLWYTTYAAYQNSAHGSTMCSGCHNVHGSAGAYPGMTKAEQEDLCYQCHTDGMVQNNAISGAALADDIQQAFSLAESHNLGTPYTINAKDYSLECISCHNVHIVTGRYDEADSNRSPVTLASDPTSVWGDDAGEKMNDFAGTGTYRTPNGDPFTGSQLPDYVTFCLDCHGSGGAAPFGIDWTGRPHGKQAANSPNGGGTCPDWYTCGKAEGWDGDDCVGTNDDCWPTMTRGKGDQLWSRPPYNHEERIAGANFTLSCTDCHEAHGSNVSSMIRSNPNGGTGTVTWNTMCNNCHYYYSDWHAGMSCGTASCHVTNSIHRMANYSGTGATRSFEPGLVLHYAFENNLNDSGDWRMHGKWMDNIAGSYASGKAGQAVVLDGGKNVQAGTRNDYWSTDAGRHGTHIYTDMKYNTTLEAWVYPTEDTNSEYSIFTKHTGYDDGGYAFVLRKVNGTLRASFICQIDDNGFSQDGRAGLRGAYSTISIPLNTWTHVAATFDTDGPDRDSDDPSIGRIRIYVNGEDVTTSDPSGSYMQPGTGETSIYAYVENSPWNEGICYNGTWCASEFSVGGFYGWQNEFIGRIDEAKVWNVTKDQVYFAAYDSSAPPYISAVEGTISSDQVTVTFSEGVYTSSGSSGALQVADFTLTDTDDGRIVTGVIHTPGGTTATLTLSAPLDATDDFNVDTLAAVSNEIYDDNDNTADTTAVPLTMTTSCPTGQVTFDLNDPPGSTYILDDQLLLSGQAFGAGTLTGSEFSGGGDGSGQYIMFNNNDSCLQADTAMTIEARILPANMTGTADYIRRIFARDSGGNYQLSVWRNNSWTNYNAPDGEASIALWTNVLDSHGGNAWKPVLTNYTGAGNGTENDCPIVSDHWYLVKAVWNSAKPGGTPGQFFTPADIYIDDQGSDGLGTGENWSGYINCTDADQSLKEDASKHYTGDAISPANGNFAIGANRNDPLNNLFDGLIDWIQWEDAVY